MQTFSFKQLGTVNQLGYNKNMNPIRRPNAKEVKPLPQAEVLSSPETQGEVATDVRVESTPRQENISEDVPQMTPVAQPVAAPDQTVKDEQLQQIEEMLSEDLGDLYKQLPPNVQPVFKAKGEEVAQTIRTWIQETKITARKVLGLIREWLGLIPNVNKFYLEQESKIKTDKIMELSSTNQEQDIFS
jgi:hypothetical protein